MTTATAPAASLTDGAFLGLAFGGALVERPGDEFGTYMVRSHSAAELVEAIEAVGAKIAAKLPAVVVHTYVDTYTGSPLVWCAQHRTFADADRSRCHYVADRFDEYVAPCAMYPTQAVTVEVRVEGLPMWGDWAVGGVLTRDDQHAVVATSVGARHDDESFAHRYSHLMGECAHCQLVRNRRTTVLLVNTVTGEVRAIGRTCLTQYTGGMIRVEALATMTSLQERFATEVGGVLAAEGASAPTVDIVALAMRYIALDGRYIKANDYGPREVPTAARVRDALFFGDQGPRPLVVASDLTDADRAAAAEAIALVMSETTDAGYVLNLQAVAEHDWAQITGRRNRVGLLASLPVAARNIRDRAARAEARAAAEAAAATKVNAHIGEPKQRRDFVGVVDVARMVEVTDYSPYSSTGTTMAEMLVVDTAEGTIKVVGTINWACGQPVELADLVGQRIALTGTIAPKNAHGEYKGLKQTRLNRVKVAKIGA